MPLNHKFYKLGNLNVIRDKWIPCLDWLPPLIYQVIKRDTEASLFRVQHGTPTQRLQQYIYIYLYMLQFTSTGNFSCCGADQHRPECLSIPVPDKDPFFTTVCMPMTRSAWGFVNHRNTCKPEVFHEFHCIIHLFSYIYSFVHLSLL